MAGLEHNPLSLKSKNLTTVPREPRKPITTILKYISPFSKHLVYSYHKRNEIDKKKAEFKLIKRSFLFTIFENNLDPVVERVFLHDPS